MIPEAQANRLLQVWEQGAARGAATRALLLLSAALPQHSRESLGEITIGARDAHLLTLRRAVFGQDLHCLAKCPACGEHGELYFSVDDIRADFAPHGETHRVESCGYSVQFRMPHSADMIALASEPDCKVAVERLLARCVLDVTHESEQVKTSCLPANVVASIELRMSEIDPQADVEIDITCPGCGIRTRTPFDIVKHLWVELDHWVRTVFREIHAIACAYGWTEGEILALGQTRRRAYLDLIEARR
jgi:hypothetical protein